MCMGTAGGKLGIPHEVQEEAENSEGFGSHVPGKELPKAWIRPNVNN